MSTNIRKNRQTLAQHEAGHAIVATLFGVPIEEIQMTYRDVSGCVWYDDDKYNLLSPDNKAILALAGLAAERFFNKTPGLLYWFRKTSYGLKLLVAKEEGLDGDLQTLAEVTPISTTLLGVRETWCNQRLETAWKLLHDNREAFLALTDVLQSPKHAYECGHDGCHLFNPRSFNRILKKVKTTKAAA